jgi:tetratricopeptide (TPR) repeat protein
MSGNYYNLQGQPSPNRPHEGIEDSLVIQFNGEEIHIIHVPRSHTDSDVYVYFVDSKIVAAGDLFFSDQIPYINLNAGGTVDGYIGQIESFMNDFPEGVTFIASHGRAYKAKDLMEYHLMLTETTRRIRDEISAGKLVDELVEENILAEWAEWKGSFASTSLEAWIQTVGAQTGNDDNPRISICEPLTAILANGSGQEAITEYQRIKSEESDRYNIDEAELNMLGYQLLMRQRLDDALEIFKLNTELYPNSFNVYDSYGEALLARGDTSQSIINYEKSLELNPENVNAVGVLEKLGQ